MTIEKSTCPHLDYKVLGIVEIIRNVLGMKVSKTPICKVLYNTIDPLERFIIGNDRYLKYFLVCPYGSNAILKICQDENTMQRLKREYAEMMNGHVVHFR